MLINKNYTRGLIIFLIKKQPTPSHIPHKKWHIQKNWGLYFSAQYPTTIRVFFWVSKDHLLLLTEDS